MYKIAALAARVFLASAVLCQVQSGFGINLTVQSRRDIWFQYVVVVGRECRRSLFKPLTTHFVSKSVTFGHVDRNILSFGTDSHTER